MSPEAGASVAGRGAAGATCSATAVPTVAAARAAWSCEVVGAGAAGAGPGEEPCPPRQQHAAELPQHWCADGCAHNASATQGVSAKRDTAAVNAINFGTSQT